MKKRSYIKICPRCGSTEITPYTKRGGIWGEDLIDYCKNCSYGKIKAGFFPEVEESKVEDFKRKLKRKR